MCIWFESHPSESHENLISCERFPRTPRHDKSQALRSADIVMNSTNEITTTKNRGRSKTTLPLYAEPQQQDLNNLLVAAPAPDCARLRSCGDSYNVAWLTAASISTTFHLSSAEHKFLMRFRLDLPAFVEGGFYTGKYCRCRLDAYDYHSIFYIRNGRAYVHYFWACNGWMQIFQEIDYNFFFERLLYDTCVVMPPVCI